LKRPPSGDRSKRRPPLPPGPYLVVGLARSGIAAARLLRSRGEDVIGVDRAPSAEARDLVGLGVEVMPETKGAAPFDRVRAVVKSPGVPAENALIAAARQRGVPVIGELELAWRLLANDFIAVTGTNGKTTTVELIGHIHRQAGLPVAVAGNVGVALSGVVGAVGPDVAIVCEASSFQLEDTLDFAPEAAVLLNLTPDHLDRHGTFERYREAKLAIFARQAAEDVAVVPAELDLGDRGGAARRVEFGGGEMGSGPARRDGERGPGLTLHDGRLWWLGGPLMDAREVRLRGAHNLQNAMAAAAVCLARGLAVEAVTAGLRGFAGVPHRLEELATVDGVLYVNDSKATNVASTLVALDAMASDGLPVHLIVGGLGKGQDFSPLAPAVQRGCRTAYVIGQDASALARALASTDVPVSECGTLERALAEARRTAVPGDVVLLSPGCASFDQFADFEARGERFRELVASLAAAPPLEG
jgi:UDP-N-acetylmuramoylalanine--D-glutamate ligase